MFPAECLDHAQKIWIGLRGAGVRLDNRNDECAEEAQNDPNNLSLNTVIFTTTPGTWTLTDFWTATIDVDTLEPWVVHYNDAGSLSGIGNAARCVR